MDGVDIKDVCYKLEQTNALLRVIGAILIHQCEFNEKEYAEGFFRPMYSIADLRRSLIKAGSDNG